jgi:hypothetical protein
LVGEPIGLADGSRSFGDENVVQEVKIDLLIAVGERTK